MNNGHFIPLILKYDQRFYTEDSPWVLFSLGTTRSDNLNTDGMSAPASWQLEDIALMSRGFVCAYPLVSGVN